MGAFGRAFKARFDQRSPLPLMMYAFLILPAVSSSWLQQSLDLLAGVTNKNLKHLEEEKVIVQWNQPISSGGGRPMKLWAGAALADTFERTQKIRSRRHSANSIPLPSPRSEEHTSELQSLMSVSYDVLFMKKQSQHANTNERSTQ